MIIQSKITIGIRNFTTKNSKILENNLFLYIYVHNYIKYAHVFSGSGASDTTAEGKMAGSENQETRSGGAGDAIAEERDQCRAFRGRTILS
ncbi:hypothetical protein STZ1_30861 [Bacillus subtilis]